MILEVVILDVKHGESENFEIMGTGTFISNIHLIGIPKQLI